MKAKLFISFAAFAAASVLMSGCSNEESTAATNDQLTSFTGGIVTEVPMKRVQIGTPGGSIGVSGFTTRTSMNRNAIGREGVFLWEPGDVIYVEDDNNKLCKSLNEITESAPRIKFLVDGSYTGKSQYEVYYFGENPGAAEKKVVIADNQTQSEFNNTTHFGKVGDCGEAKAEKTTVSGKSGYKFDLEHAASYLCFLPYITSQEERESYKIKRIEITSDYYNIAGTYELIPSIPGHSDLSHPPYLLGEGESKKITLHVGTDGLLLADQTTATKSIKNSLYAVIAPGEYALKVKYTVLDTKTNKVIEMTKSYKQNYFAANAIYDIPVRLGSLDSNGGSGGSGGEGGEGGSGGSGGEGGEGGSGGHGRYDLYGGHNYYMWDALKNYWSGHEWDVAVPWQPTVEGVTNYYYPRSNADPRWYHEGNGFVEASVNPLFKQLPNANEMAWYVLKGDAHWDNTTKWMAFGKIHTGGIWLKKLRVIAQERGKKLAALKLKDPRGKDLRTTIIDIYKGPFANGKPADSVIDKYFFLPALGYYYKGKFYKLGSDGYYWSSNGHFAVDTTWGYHMAFDSDGVFLWETLRSYGVVAHPFQ